MLISLEVPSRNLQLGASHSDYLFVLPQIYLESEEYREFVDRYPGQKFLDNGAYELGKSLDFSKLMDVVYSILPDVFVLPDVLGSFKETVGLTHRFYSEFNRAYSPKTRLMVVAQGSNIDERLRCLFKLRRLVKFDMVGLPRIAAPRLKLFQAVAKFFKKPIHLLGCPDPYEVRDIVALSSPLLYSMDTSWVARDALGIGEKRKLDFEKDQLDVDAFFDSYNRFLDIVFGRRD